jgi:hypothetical protein
MPNVPEVLDPDQHKFVVYFGEIATNNSNVAYNGSESSSGCE